MKEYSNAIFRNDMFDSYRIMWKKIKNSSHRQVRLLKGEIKAVELSITGLNQTEKFALDSTV